MEDNTKQKLVDEGKDLASVGAESPLNALEDCSICTICGQPKSSGIYTSGDGYNDAQYIGITRPEMRFYCWDCNKEHAAEIPNLDKRIDEGFKAGGLCGFLEAWVGRCRNPNPCSKHAEQACRSCGATATQNCSETGQFVCGEPLCNDCEHTIYPSGTNGGVGFNAQDLPEGMKRHCRKTEQRYKPWYVRDNAPERETET